jgi:hypothetical protein
MRCDTFVGWDLRAFWARLTLTDERRKHRYKAQTNELRYTFTPSSFYAAADAQPGPLRLVTRVQAVQEGFGNRVTRGCAMRHANV